MEQVAVRVFLHDVNSYLARNLAKQIKQTFETSTDGSSESVRLVGTARFDEKGEKPLVAAPEWCNDVINWTNDKEIKRAILASNVIVYDMFQNLTETTNALKVLVREPYAEEKCFICISTLMSWAKTVAPEDEEGAKFSETMLDKRKPHPSFKPYVTTENLVLSKGNSKRDELKTFVIWPGLLYGGGEEIFHPLFRSGWEGIASEVNIFRWQVFLKCGYNVCLAGHCPR